MLKIIVVGAVVLFSIYFVGFRRSIPAGYHMKGADGSYQVVKTTLFASFLGK